MKLWSTNMTITSFLGRSLARLPLPSLGGMRYLVETKRRVKTKIVIIQKSYINGSGRVRLPPEEWLEEKKNWYAEGRLMSRSYSTVQCWLFLRKMTDVRFLPPDLLRGLSGELIIIPTPPSIETSYKNSSVRSAQPVITQCCYFSG